MTSPGSTGVFMGGWPPVSWAPLPAPPAPHRHNDVPLIPFEFSEGDIAQFEEKGYIQGPQILSADSIAFLREEIERVFRGEVDNASSPYEYNYWLKAVEKYYANSPDVRKINNVWWINTAIRSVVTSEVIGRAAAQLLHTKEIRLWHDQAICKPPLTMPTSSSSSSLLPSSASAGNIGWHQDYGFWQISNSSNMITAWIPLQDVDMENGAMRTIVGSHKWGVVPDSAKFFDKDLESLKDKFTALQKGDWVDEPAIMKAGHVVFHHALTFHASGPNNSSSPRWALAVHMQSEGCGFQSGKGWHHNMKDLGPDPKEGQRFDGPLFPILFPK
eukprot:TRINITY_DN6543_c0_g1_i1.p1 TRINITY_DN6543_c0_g1~~TRINITY_DN6543_c0_g1_i1.p1  ORF type:complete len:329 (+),score=53.27 TRINITY_DN6543_c0_g1_i1:899-1885(+)